MVEKTTVSFRIDESVKQEWEEAAERPEYDSLSHLLRLAVQREIADTATAHTGEQPQSGAINDGEVLESLTRIERVMTDVQEEVETLGREDRAGELYDLEQVLLEVLPPISQGFETTPELEPDAFNAEKARTLAGRIGADTSDVADALDRLTENMAQVRSATYQETGEEFYWRVE